jgi:hypothetical protein
MKRPPLETAAVAFMRAADTLLNAMDRIQKHDPGSKGRAKAIPVLAAANINYEDAHSELSQQLSQAIARRAMGAAVGPATGLAGRRRAASPSDSFPPSCRACGNILGLCTCEPAGAR